MNVIPIIYEISLWRSLTSPNPEAPDAWFKSMKYDKELVIKLWREAVESGSSFFNGPNSVVHKLGL